MNETRTGFHAIRAALPASNTRTYSPTSVALGVGLASLAAYLLIQFGLETMRFAAQVSSFALQYGQDAARTLESPITANLVASATNFLALALGTAALVQWKRGFVFIVPAALVVVLPWVANRLQLACPYPLGQGWLQTTGPWPAGRYWLGASIDLTLAIAPALMLYAHRSSLAESTNSRLDASVESKLSAFALCLYVVGLYAWTQSMASEASWWREIEGSWVIIVPVCVLGAILGLRDLRRSLAIAIVAVLTWWQFTIPGADGHLHALPTISQFAQTLPLVLLAGVIAAWQPAARGLDRLSHSVLGLILVVNALNVVDAFLTSAAVRSGEAAELNPFIRVVGLPAKIIIVAIVSVLLARFRPRTLIWPALALAAVFAWHVAGLMAG